MALLFMDGFDHYATADLTRKWSATGGTIAPIISAGAGRFGGTALLAPNNSSNSSLLTRNFPNTASWIIGAAVKITAYASASTQIFQLLEGGTLQCELRINAEGTLCVTRNAALLTGATSTKLLPVGAWFYLEWKVTIANSIAANSCKVRVNGEDWITVPAGQDTQNTANAYANALRVGAGSFLAAIGTWTIDDLYVCDSSGTVNNDFLGDVRVETIFPTGVGNSTQFTPSAGSNYQCVDDSAPNDDTDYVVSSTVGQKDTYALGDLASTPAAIYGVQITMLQRKDDAGTRTVRPVTRSGGTDYPGTSINLNSSYAYDSQIREVDPATGVAWTGANVNAMEVGPEVVA